MNNTYLLLGVALATALGTWLKPGQAAGVLLLAAPIIWGGGSADMRTGPSEGMNLPAVVSGIATFMYARFLFRRQAHSPLDRLRMACIVYCLAVLPSVFMGDSFVQGFGGYVRLISPIVFLYALLYTCRPQGTASFQFKTVAIAPLSLLAVIVAAHYAGEDSFSMGGFERLRAFHLSPQHISMYSVTACGVLLCGMLADKRRPRYAVPLALILVSAYLTGYRTAWIGISVVVVIVLLATHSRAGKWVVLLLVLGAIVQSGSLVHLLARYDQVDQGLSAATVDSITSGRLTIDSIALDRYVAGSPSEWLLGTGVFSSEEVTRRLTGTGFMIHSDFLATLVECGIVGLLGYLFLLFTIARLLLNYRRCLPYGGTARTFLTVAWALFVAFTLMGIACALYANVFVGWYYYGFLGIALAQVKEDDASKHSAWTTSTEQRLRTVTAPV